MDKFIWVDGAGQGFEHARKVRREVFVCEQGFSEIGEFDEKDKTSLHIVGFVKNEAVCTARMFDDGKPSEKHIGRVAVLSSMRGLGVGLKMMKELISFARKKGVASLVIESQADKTKFYENAGFICTGKTSFDEGVPHEEMEMLLR